MSDEFSAGNRGAGVRSDCYVRYQPAEQGGIQIHLKSKVEVLYGDSIRQLVRDVCRVCSVDHGAFDIEDSGALPFTISARIEQAIRQWNPAAGSYLPPLLHSNIYPTPKDRFRRSRLYLPGNNPKMMINAGLHQPDGIILDLEDSVAPDKKDEARILVRNALRAVDFYGAERMVRINQLPRGLEDLDAVVPHYVNLILLPKAESAEDVKAVAERIRSIKNSQNLSNNIWMMPIIESAKGVVNAYAIATAAPEVAALAIGLEDYTADLGTQRSDSGRESFFARSQVVNAARAAGIQPIDSVFSDVSNMDALTANVAESKSLGFDGMGCIHPRQIPVIHNGYAPADAEIEKAKKIVLAFDQASASGLGVVSLGSKMIDPPVVKRALHTIDLAVRSGKLSANWKETL